MPKIISLEKKKRLYKVVFDDERTIYVTEDTIVRFFLSKGAVFENAEIEKIAEFADFSREKIWDSTIFLSSNGLKKKSFVT